MDNNMAQTHTMNKNINNTINGTQMNSQNMNSVPIGTMQGNPIQERNNQPQLNINDVYGLGNQSICSGDGCLPNTATDYGYTIPSLDEIASYNQSRIVESKDSHTSSNPISQIPAVSALQESDRTIPFEEETIRTPVTVMNDAQIPQNIVMNQTQGSVAMNQWGSQISDIANPYPVTAESIQYLNGFIRTQIGRRVTIDFLVGSNQIVSKSGYLLGVAANYILINELDTNDITTCDFYNIKFIRFYY